MGRHGSGGLGLFREFERRVAARAERADKKPNFVIIFADDLGYGDLGCYGHPTIRTPNLDRMAAEGQRWTEFYVAASVCTPSRAGLLTGRLPIRSGMCSDRAPRAVPRLRRRPAGERDHDRRGAQAQGYATACIGKWHLGHLPQYLPTSNGFDSYFGIPYSNDMDRVAGAEGRRAVLRSEGRVLERAADARTSRSSSGRPTRTRSPTATPRRRSSSSSGTRTGRSSSTSPTPCRTCRCSPRTAFRGKSRRGLLRRRGRGDRLERRPGPRRAAATRAWPRTRWCSSPATTARG